MFIVSIIFAGTNPYKRNKKPNQKDTKTSTDIAEENIKKLLALSTPAVDKKTAEKVCLLVSLNLFQKNLIVPTL